jgi:hypothetical protein
VVGLQLGQNLYSSLLQPCPCHQRLIVWSGELFV